MSNKSKLICEELKKLPDYRQTPVMGVMVIRWPSFGHRCYELETVMRRPGWGLETAARIIGLMVDGDRYYEAVKKVTGKNLKKQQTLFREGKVYGKN